MVSSSWSSRCFVFFDFLIDDSFVLFRCHELIITLRSHFGLGHHISMRHRAVQRLQCPYRRLVYGQIQIFKCDIVPSFVAGIMTSLSPLQHWPSQLERVKNSITHYCIITLVAPSIAVKSWKRAPHCQAINDKCFRVSETFWASEESAHRLEADGEGRLRFRFVCDDGSKPICESGDDEEIIE